VYARQLEYAEKERYEAKDALFEVYVTDPTTVESESNLITEVYYLIKK
jgi:effector-binding domain-containing protein